MIKKSYLLVLTVIISSLVLTACAGGAPGGAAPGAGGPGGSEKSKTTTEVKTAMGIIALEDTDQAVTVDQAKVLLPLYKAVKALGASATTAPAELEALYSQIRENLDSSQIQTIDNLDVSSQTIQAVLTKYGAISDGLASEGSRSTTRSSSNGGFGGPGGPGGGPGGPGGMMMGGGDTAMTIATSAVGKGVTQTINSTLLNAVIKLLGQRAGIPTDTSTVGAFSAQTDTPVPSTPTPVSKVKSTEVPTDKAQ